MPEMLIGQPGYFFLAQRVAFVLLGIALIALALSWRKRAALATRLAESERHNRGLVEGSPNGIALVDDDGFILAMNAIGRDLLSLSDAVVVGQRLPDVWPAPAGAAIGAALDRARHGERLTIDLPCERAGHAAISLRLTLSPVTDETGRVIHSLVVLADATERQRAELALERSHRFTQVILAISARFLGLRTERVDAAVRGALGEIGAFLGVDRVQLFTLSPDLATFSLTHEWCSPGVRSRMPSLQAVPVGDFPWVWSLLEEQGVVTVADVASIPQEGAVERANMQSQGVGALLCVSVRRRGSVTGFLALDVFNRRRDWPADEATLLRIAADVLSNGLARKQADAALRESEQRFQMAFRNNPAAMAIVWTDGHRVVEANEAYIRLLSSTRDEVIDRALDPSALIVGEEAQRVVAASLDRTEPFRDLELRLRTANGESRDVSLSMDVFDLAGQRFMLAVALDLSARTRAEETLREREEVFHSISTAAQDAIIMIDSEARVTVWNESAERMFGYTREEAEGRALNDLIMPEEYESGFMMGFAQFRVSGEGQFVGTPQQMFGRRKNGTQIPVELSASAVQVRGRWHAVGILRDITERLKVEEELWKAKEETEAANAELQRSVERARRLAEEAGVANASKSEFLANMSHEIRTPMNGIIGMTGLLLDTDLTADQREQVDTVRTCADSLLTIINGILDFSKIEAGKLDLEVIDFDLASTIEETADVLAIRAHEKGLEVASFVAPDVPTLLRGDPGRLRQVLTNLLGNAIKFTRQGEVTLSVSVDAQNDHDVVLRFVVRDTGIGIPADKVDALFRPFTQVDSSTTRRFGGTGLGLSISRRLALLMGGTVGVESGEGVGSGFWFTARLERQAGSRPAAGSPVPRIDGVRVLGLEGSPTSRRALSGVLESCRCRHTEVGSAAEALERLREAALFGDPYRVAILDMDSGDIPVAELAGRVSGDLLLSTTRLVLMTPVGRRGDSGRIRELGFSGYLTKPVKLSQVRGVIAALVGQEGTGASREAPASARPSADDAERPKTRILLVEDNITNQKVATKVLEKMGHRVEAAANGLEAIRALRETPYDLVLMDVQMPEMDGLEATRRIRDLATGAQNPRIPIVAMTAHAMKGDRERCLAAGMDDYLSKPINPADVAAAVARWALRGASEAGTAPEIHAPATPTAGVRADGPAQAPGFDRAALLDRLGGDEEVLVDVISIFLEDAPRQVRGMDDAFAAGDMKTLRRLAHTLKGASGTTGAAVLQQASLALEQAAASGDPAAAGALIQPVKDSCADVLATMSGWLGESRT